MNNEPLSREERIAEARRVRDAACEEADAAAFDAAYTAANAYADADADANAYAAYAEADAAADATWNTYLTELARIDKEYPA